MGTWFSLSIVLYENTIDARYRTLINRLFTLQVMFSCSIFNIHYLASTVRANFGPLPVIVCRSGNFLILIFAYMTVLLMNEIVFVRYLYVCVFKCVGVLNEDLIFYFLVIGKYIKYILISITVQMEMQPDFLHLILCCV